MNEWEIRLHEVAAKGALFDADVVELSVCAKEVGIRVELERVDLAAGSVRPWAIEADGSRSETGAAKPGKAPARRRSRNGVQVVGAFQWEIPDEVQAGQKSHVGAQARPEHPGFPAAAADAGTAGAGLFPGLD